MSSYLAVTDLRPKGDGITGQRWADISIPVSQVSDSRLTTLISSASDFIDAATGDSFSSTTYTYDGGVTAPDFGLLVLDGPVPNAFGHGGPTLFPPDRIVTLNNVYLLPPYNASPVLVPTVYYKVHKSNQANRPDDFDGIELITGVMDNGITSSPWAAGNSFFTWWPIPRGIGLDGTFGWSSTPDPIARATARIVQRWATPNNIPIGAQSYSSGGAHFSFEPGTVNKNMGGLTYQTGDVEVDLIIQRYSRRQTGPIPV